MTSKMTVKVKDFIPYNSYVMVHGNIWLLDPIVDTFKDKQPQKLPQMTSEVKGH